MYEEVIDGEQLQRWLDKMSDENYQRRVLYKAILDGAKVIQTNTKESFRRKMGEASTHFSKDVGGPFYDGVTLRGDRAYLEARVAIMKDYRMKWFEKGTVDRQHGYKYREGSYKRRFNKSGSSHSTGRIKPLYFFRETRQSSEGQMEEAIMNSINNAYKKLEAQSK